MQTDKYRYHEEGSNSTPAIRRQWYRNSMTEDTGNQSKIQKETTKKNTIFFIICLFCRLFMFMFTIISFSICKRRARKKQHGRSTVYDMRVAIMGVRRTHRQSACIQRGRWARSRITMQHYTIHQCFFSGILMLTECTHELKKKHITHNIIVVLEMIECSPMLDLRSRLGNKICLTHTEIDSILTNSFFCHLQSRPRHHKKTSTRAATQTRYHFDFSTNTVSDEKHKFVLIGIGWVSSMVKRCGCGIICTINLLW